MSSRIRSGLIAIAIGVIVLVATSLRLSGYPKTVFEFFATVVFYAGLVLFSTAVQDSRPFRIFLIACVTILIGGLALAVLYRVAPEYFAPGYAIAGALTVMLFLRSDRLTREQKAAVALLLARVVGALLLLIAVVWMMPRAGHIGGVLAIWIFVGVLAAWRALHEESPIDALFRMMPDPWRRDRDKDGTWRA